MVSYTTVADVRRTSGISNTEISDADVTSIINEVEPQIERYYNTKFIPTERIDILDGNGTQRIILDKNPVLSVRQIRTDGTTEDPSYLHTYRESGKIELDNNQSLSVNSFKRKKQAVVVKYLYGFVEESSTNTNTTADADLGTDVSLSVSSITDFSDEDWVEIYGMDGNKEVAQINTSPAGSTIQVDQLVMDHESGSKVVKVEASQVLKKIVNVCCSIAMVTRIIGQSYDDIVGYNLGEMHVQKGEPYTQWRETANQLIKERDDLLKRIPIRLYIA